jgi:hypothetical protein
MVEDETGRTGRNGGITETFTEVVDNEEVRV